MKFSLLSAFVSVIFATTNAMSGNALPEITDFDAKVNTSANQLIVTYNLVDADDDKIKISLRIFDNQHNFITASESSATGDVGFPVVPGVNKRIVWTYPDSLNISEYRLKLIADDLYKIDPQEIVDQVNKERMSKQINHVYGIRAHDKGKSLIRLIEVRDYLASTFLKNEVFTYRQKAPVDKYNIENIIGIHEGNYDEKKTFILSAHYDSETKGPGADDNASGVLGLLEVMNVLSKYDFDRTIKFIAFDGEEIGHLGSKLYVRGATHIKEQIEGVINFDMIGFYSNEPNTQRIPFGYNRLFPAIVEYVINDDLRGNFVLNTANTNSSSLGEAFANNAGKYAKDLKVVSLVTKEHGQLTPQLAASDHLQFWRGDFKAIHIGDGGATRNKNLDTKNDVLNTLNYDFMTSILKATVATLVDLAGVRHCSSVEGDLQVISN